jgi:hypothetical protein
VGGRAYVQPTQPPPLIGVYFFGFNNLFDCDCGVHYLDETILDLWLVCHTLKSVIIHVIPETQNVHWPSRAVIVIVWVPPSISKHYIVHDCALQNPFPFHAFYQTPLYPTLPTRTVVHTIPNPTPAYPNRGKLWTPSIF